MKIAVPVNGNVVDDHFGHSEFFRVFTVENNKIVNTEDVASPKGCGCKTDIIPVLKSRGVETMLIGNMGQGAFNKVTSHGIRVFRGCNGEVAAVMNDYLAGKIQDSFLLCNNHGDDHECAH